MATTIPTPRRTSLLRRAGGPGGLAPGPLLLAGLVLVTGSLASPASADPYPPYWNAGAGGSIHFQPAPWPANDGDGELDFGDWVPYTMVGADTQDNGTQDPSNGGTSPQNYVNVSSGCTDLTIPSIFLYYDSTEQVLMFRWRVEQIANTYATGPNAGVYGSTDVWKSAQWTVLVDTNADGYRDFAALVDGSSGAPGTAIDRMLYIWGSNATQSIDYVNDPDIHLLGHNPTAFVDGPGDDNTEVILNFQDSLVPIPAWQNGSAETVWDYGTTRARKLVHTTCVEYFIDYQIPLAALDATAVGGPQVTEDTPLCVLFSTANSLNDPLQKDVALNCDPNAGCSFCADVDEPAPFGDCFKLGDFGGGGFGVIEQPTVNEITASGCSPQLDAIISDAVEPTTCGAPLDSSIASADFYYYYDANANGLADDGNSWTLAAAATEQDIGEWRATAGSWNTTVLRNGSYLIGVSAEDDQGNVTWSHLTQTEVNTSFPGDFANPSPDPGVLFTQFVNTCGTSPSATKSASASSVSIGSTVDFTITVSAATSDSLTLTSIEDYLPTGWTFASNQGGTLTPTTSPSGGASGTLTWTFAPAVTIPAGASRTLIFRATAPLTQGTFSNTARAISSDDGNLDTNTVEVAVGAPRLTFNKAVDDSSTVPGGTVVFTLTYSNDSPVSVTNVVITDPLPQGMTFVSATGGGTHDGLTPGTVTWNIGSLASGSGTFSVSFTATVNNPFTATNPAVNTATIDSTETAPANDSASVFVTLPLRIQKSASSPQVAPGANVTFTLTYTNTGTSAVTGTTITDPVPAGFTFVSATGGGTLGSGVVTWNIGNLAAGASGSVTVTLTAANPYASTNPQTNTATLSATGISPISDSYQVGVTQACTANTTYYFKNATANVGFDGTRPIANTTAPSSATATEFPTPPAQTVLAAAATNVEIGRFYQDPAQATGGGLSTITSTFYINKIDAGDKIDFRLQAYDYNPTTGAATLLGTTATYSANGGAGYYVASAATITPSGPLPTGHRIQWRIVADNTSGGGKLAEVRVVYDGTSQQAQSSFCVTPYRQTLDKQVNNLSVAPGGTLQYTLQFGNSGTASLTGATIVDTLPTGVSFTSATLNGSAITPGISGQQLTFTVNGVGNPSGTITGGNTGTLVINVSVASPLSTSISTLVNNATLSSNEATAVNDSASTVVSRPNLVISKAASDTLVFPGDTVTYTLTLTNSGNATAANVSIADDIPNQTYYPYVAASCSVNTTAAPSTSSTSCTPSGSPVGALAITANQLVPGETIVVTFQMTVTSSPAPPSGLSTHDNLATATSTTDTAVATSETVTVTISTNPNLVIAKTSDAVGTLAAGDVVTYTVTLSNTGSATATSVVVTDPIPSNTDFLPGTITYESVSQTDANDGDTGRYELLADRVVWAVGSLAAGASRTMTFDVELDATLPNGTTTITNTATVTAANAASMNDSTDVSASAAPSWDLTKNGPSSLAFPLTTLASAASATTTLSVVSAAYLSIGDWIFINGTATQITGISGTTVTVSVAVTAPAAAAVNPIIEYTLTWENTGTATATGVVVTDALPASTAFVSATGGGTHNGGSPGIVTWTVGTVAPGASTTVRLRIRPTAVGTFVNDFDVASNEVATATSNTVTTQVGALRPAKTTSTPSVTNTPNGTKATYSLTVVNDSAVNATGVTVTDTMATGFTYCDNSCDDGTTNFNNPTFSVSAGSRTSTVNPTVGENPLTFCCWTVNAGATLTITFDAKIGIAVGDGTYQNEVATSSSNVAALIFDPLSTTAEDVTVDFVGPNPVMLSGFGASLVDGQVTVSWETDAEIDAMAFRVYRLDRAQGGYLPIHRDLLPGLIGAPQGGLYSLADPTAPTGEPLSYLLVEVDGRGRRTTYGPYELPAPSAGERLVPAARTKRSGYGAVPHSLRQPPAEEISKAAGSRKASGARIGVASDGLQRLPVADLAAAFGMTAGDVQKLVQSRRLRLSLGGSEVAWMPEGDGRTAAAILFYGRGGDTRWSAERFYRLEPQPGGAMATVKGAPGTPVSGLTFRDTARFERDVYPLVLGRLDPDADLYYWDFAFAGFPGFDRRTFDLDLDGSVTTGSPAVVRVRLQGGTDLGSGSHGVALAWDGVGIGTTTLGSYEGREVALAVPAALLGPGLHRLEVKATGATTSGMSLILIDTIAVDFDRAYATNRPAVEVLRGTATTLAVSGLPGASSTVLDVSNPLLPKLVTGATSTSSGGSWEVRFSGTGSRYLVATDAGKIAPASLRADHASDLRSAHNRADWIVVTTAGLADAAERLADLRRAQGLEAMVVDVDDVYDEFSGGQPTPWALRDFLTWAVAEWQVGPRYLVLAGDGHYDFHGATGIGGNLLPPAILGATWGLFASDGPLGDLLGDDGIPEVVVGRIPVHTAAELDAYVAKVAAAEAGGSWNGTILFAADDPDSTGSYTADSEALAALVPPAAIVDRVYLGPLGTPAARSRLFADLQAGVSLVSYLGHSGITTLANEGLLTSSDVPTLQNGDRAPVLLAMGCHLGNFAIPGSPSLAEDLLTRDDGGAVAVWSAVGISYNPLRSRLTEESLRAVYHDGHRVLGDVVREALEAAAASGLGKSLAESQVLLGDPAIRLPEAP